MGNHDPEDPQAVEVEVEGPAPNVRLNARKLVEDAEYQENLLARMRAGLAGPLEVQIWRYAYGDPKIHHRVQVDDQKKFAQLREAVKELRLKNPERAKLLDMAVQSADAQPAQIVEDTNDDE